MPSPTVSDRKIVANRSNALKSTGPKSESGKAASSQNARKHGHFCKDLVLPDEDAQAFEWMKQDILRTLNPATAMELALVEQIVANEWRIKRVRANEAKLAAEGNEQDQKQLERYQSYELRLRGSVFRCLRELRKLRSEDVTKATDLTEIVLGEESAHEEVRNEPTSTVTVVESITCDNGRPPDQPSHSPGRPGAALAMAVSKTIQDLESPSILRKTG